MLNEFVLDFRCSYSKRRRLKGDWGGRWRLRIFHPCNIRGRMGKASNSVFPFSPGLPVYCSPRLVYSCVVAAATWSWPRP